MASYGFRHRSLSYGGQVGSNPHYALQLADASFFETSLTAHPGGCPSAAAIRKTT
jgi:hypothetical protein